MNAKDIELEAIMSYTVRLSLRRGRGRKKKGREGKGMGGKSRGGVVKVGKREGKVSRGGKGRGKKLNDLSPSVSVAQSIKSHYVSELGRTGKAEAFEPAALDLTHSQASRCPSASVRHIWCPACWSSAKRGTLGLLSHQLS